MPKKRKIKKRKKKNNPFSYSAWKLKGEKSKSFDSWKIYIIKCWNEEETFYKVGKSFKTVIDRFSELGAMPYEYEIIYQKTSSSSYKISKLEQEIHNKLKEYKYKPLKKFGGCNECFINIDNYDQQTT
jgi:hypothetical protein